MLDSIYTASSGLQSFSKGIDVISDNVTNVNTVGYKATNLIYEDVHYQHTLTDGKPDNQMHGSQIGSGVAANVTTTLFNQGDLRQTGGDNDAAINGKGFFVLEKDGERVYSRNGQFDFDQDGDLSTADRTYKVLGMNANGSLQRINENNLKIQPAVPTSTIALTGNLSTGSSTATFNATIIDPLGGSHNFTFTLTRDTEDPFTWVISAVDENQAAVGTSGSVSFQANGSPAENANTYTFTYQAQNTPSQQIKIDFGTSGSFSGVTSFSSGSTSNVSVSKQDGNAQGSLLSITFDSNGNLIAKYSNNQTVTGPQLALANFDDLQSLIRLDGGFFRPQTNQKAIYGVAGKDSFGTISGGNLESSNVDLSQQFSDMIIIQRGYQASSQMLTAVNEMMQQLLEINKK
jgi:flagellar hook protein FlgE